MKIAIIPARKGSTRIPNKNIKLFFGKPILSYTIETAKKTRLFDKIVVSTDCKKIANIACKFGAEVPFLRPKYLAKNFISTHAVVKHVLKFYLKLKIDITQVCCLYPCAPLLNCKDIISTYKILKKNSYSYIVTNFDIDISTALYMNPNDIMKRHNYKELKKLKNSLYCDAGQLYWADTKTWLNSGQDILNNGVGYFLPNNKIIDINQLKDWEKAKSIFKKNK